jgi:hypothetical protein
MTEVSPMSQDKKVLKSLSMLDEKTVQIEFNDEIVIELEDLRAGYKQLSEYTAEKRLKKLIITGKKTEITKEARLFGHNESLKIKDKVIAEAIVVHLLYQKMIINFYIKFIKDSYPTKFFTDVEKAKEWLRSVEG